MTTTQWDNILETNNLALTMQYVRLSAEAVAKGECRHLIVSGGAGCGKTEAVENALNAFRARGLAPIYLNPRTYRDIIEAFVEAQAESGGKPRRVRPIFCDEADLIFTSERCLNLLKIAFSPDPRRRVYQGVQVDAPVFLSTNRNLGSFPKKLAAHAEALFDRVPPIRVENDPYTSWEYACWLALTTPMIRKTHSGDYISKQNQIAALEWFTAHANLLKVIGPRALINVVRTKASALPDWAKERQLNDLLQPSNPQLPTPPEPQDWAVLMASFAKGAPAPLPKAA